MEEEMQNRKWSIFDGSKRNAKRDAKGDNRNTRAGDISDRVFDGFERSRMSGGEAWL